MGMKRLGIDVHKNSLSVADSMIRLVPAGVAAPGGR